MRIFSSSYYLPILVLYLFLLSGSTIAFSHTNAPAVSLPTEHYVSQEMFATLVQVEHAVEEAAIAHQLKTLNAFVAQLHRKQKSFRSEKRFLSHLFYKVHRKFLKRYTSHTTLYELMEQGSYDCVTGSALYAMLLDALGIPYQVHEFPYHVYLTVTTSEGDTIMLESTDPQYGFVTSPTEQKKRFAHYSQPTTSPDAEHYQYDFTIRENISLTELAGLNYFNEAVEHYNNRDFQQATQLLRQADQLYASPRMKAFKNLIASLAQH